MLAEHRGRILRDIDERLAALRDRHARPDDDCPPVARRLRGQIARLEREREWLTEHLNGEIAAR